MKIIHYYSFVSLYAGHQCAGALPSAGLPFHAGRDRAALPQLPGGAADGAGEPRRAPHSDRESELRRREGDGGKEVLWLVNSNARTREKAKEISKSRIPNFPNLLGLVLGCIEAKFCK